MNILKKINIAKKADIAELYGSETQYNCSECGKKISYYTWKEHGGKCEDCDTDYRR